MGCFSSKEISDEPNAAGVPLASRGMPQAVLSSSGKPYITQRNGKLYEGSREFRFASFNLPALLTGTAFEQNDALATIAGFATPVARTYTLQIKSQRIPTGANIVGWDAGRKVWMWDEAEMLKYDSALALAEKHNVRLIIPIINQDYGGDTNWVGNFTDLANWVEPGAHWWTSRTMIDSFKLLITDLLNRVNTKTGIRYGDDPTVLAWETGNEMNGGDNNRPPPGAWTVEIASHIKSLAPHTLVMDGSYARNESSKDCFAPEVLSPSSPVDILSYHYYGAGDARRLPNDISVAHKANKAFVAGEYGFFHDGTDFDSFLLAAKNKGASGSLVWAMRAHAQDGGFDTHAEGDGIYAYHAPGWGDGEDFDVIERGVVMSVREASYELRGERAPPFPVPTTAPEAWAVQMGGDDWGLTWRGSAWAERYEVHSDQQGQEVVLNDVRDNSKPGKFAVKLPRFQAEKVWLRVRAMSVDNQPGPFSEAVGIPGW